MQELNILVSTDHNYILQLRAMLRSLFVNNRDCDITVYLLHSGLPEEDLDLLGETAIRFNAGFAEYTVRREQQELAAAAVNGLTPETYYRLFLMDYLPETVDRVLYLDCDVLINGSLSELFNMPMSITGEDGQTRHYLFAAAPDAVEFVGNHPELTELVCERKKRVELSDSELYVNAGVLLINLKQLRSFITTPEILDIVDYFAVKKDYFFANDQDLLNLTFKSHISYIDAWLYNYFSTYRGREEIVYNEPVIIHCAGECKPWKAEYPQHTNFQRQTKILYELYASDDF